MAGWTLKADDLSRARLCLARDLPCSSEEKQIRFAHPKGGFALIRGCFFSYVHTYPDSFLFRVSLSLSLIQNPPIRTPKLFPSPHENHHFDSKNTSSPPEKTTPQTENTPNYFDFHVHPSKSLIKIPSKLIIERSNSTRKPHLRMETPSSLHTRSHDQSPEKAP